MNHFNGLYTRRGFDALLCHLCGISERAQKSLFFLANSRINDRRKCGLWPHLIQTDHGLTITPLPYLSIRRSCRQSRGPEWNSRPSPGRFVGMGSLQPPLQSSYLHWHSKPAIQGDMESIFTAGMGNCYPIWGQLTFYKVLKSQITLTFECVYFFNKMQPSITCSLSCIMNVYIWAIFITVEVLFVQRISWWVGSHLCAQYKSTRPPPSQTKRKWATMVLLSTNNLNFDQYQIVHLHRFPRTMSLVPHSLTTLEIHCVRLA